MKRTPISPAKARLIRAMLKVSNAYQFGMVGVLGMACVLFAISSIPASL